MKLGKEFQEQMSCHTHFLKNPLSWISVLAPLLILSSLLGHGFLSIVLTSTALIFASFFFFIFSKQKTAVRRKQSDTGDESHGDHESSRLIVMIEEDEVFEVMPENECIRERKETEQEEATESDSIGRSSTSEDSEANWPFQSPDRSDGSISDEDSLIEIALPGVHYISQTKNEEKPKLPDFAHLGLGSFLKQHGLMELLAELNEVGEEENLIEIDISIGSIKCPRL